MTIPAPLHRYTFRDYVLLEQASNVKHEFVGGEILYDATGVA